MTAIEELQKRAKQGDLLALQELRDSGFFQRKRAERKGYPVSAAQRRLWILEQMAATAYNMPAGILLEGPLNTDALQRALEAVVGRHESMRTTFAEIGGELRQIVHEEIPDGWEEHDLSQQPDSEVAARQQAARLANEQFDLRRGPLLRSRLLKLATDRWVFLLNVHHIVCDGWSVEVLVRELMALYAAFSRGADNSLPSLALQYRDYAGWQNRLLDGPEAQRHHDYWKGKLAGNLPILDLPLDATRPPNKTYCGKTYAHVLNHVLAQGLERLSCAQEATLFMTLTALVKLLLYRYTGARDIIVGTPYSGRDREELENQIGFYVNTLALRDEVDGEDTFCELLSRVKRTCLEAFDHQLYPFDRLVNELGVDRDLSRSPVFDVLVLVEHHAGVEFRLPGVTISAFDCAYDVAKFDLSFEFMQTSDVIHMGLNYNTDLFHESTIRRMADHFQQLASSVLAESDIPLDRLNMLTPEENRQLLSFNQPSSHGDPKTTITALFEQQVAATPDNPAVTCVDVTLSYQDLNTRANAVANCLIARHLVQPGDLIAVVLDRSEWMVAALIGILKAGGGYVPIDPEYPLRRISFMLADSRCRLVLTETRHRQLVERCLSEQASPPPAIDIGEIDATQRSTNPSLPQNPDTTAYVIYTSGSTGAPKGCIVTNANVARLMINASDIFSFSSQDVWVAAHSFCFDFSVWEMYGALLYGGSVVIARREEVRDVEALLRLLKQHRVTVLNQTPAAFYNMIEAESVCREHTLGDHLRYVIFGGDRLDPSRLRRWIEFYDCDDVKLINMYGITETTVHVTFCKLGEREILAAPGRSPIGVPLVDTAVYVCNPAMQLQPFGVVGEIYVGGSGVSRGYLNQPELTAQRFVNSPFHGDQQLYRTGDLGRWREDGTLDYLGRNDHQLQVRGYRVEPAEIEAVLGQHPQVREAVVVAKDDETGTPRLVAYFTSVAEVAPSVEHMRRFLRQHLPDWMIPATFVELKALPLTSNNKVDRHSLPAPDANRPELEQPYVAPRNDVENVLVGIFAEVLGVERAGVNDDFFELGGHSLSATQVVSRIRDTLRVEVSLRQLFAAKHVGALITLLQNHHSEWEQVEKIARVVTRLNSMSAEEKARLLEQKRRKNSKD